MNTLSSKKKPGRPESNPDSERRKVGMVVHDDRGNASVSWRDAPADFERPVLEVLGAPELTIKSEETYDPYANRTAHRASRSAGGGAGSGERGSGNRTDLRKLSEWIKMMREREQRKREGGEGQFGG